MKQVVHLKIYGRVQEVFFRQHTKEEALRLGIKGWVRNCEDGTVEAEAEGEEDALKKFVAWCHHGPAKALVSKVEANSTEAKDFVLFEVRR